MRPRSQIKGPGSRPDGENSRRGHATCPNLDRGTLLFLSKIAEIIAQKAKDCQKLICNGPPCASH